MTRLWERITDREENELPYDDIDFKDNFALLALETTIWNHDKIPWIDNLDEEKKSRFDTMYWNHSNIFDTLYTSRLPKNTRIDAEMLLSLNSAWFAFDKHAWSLQDLDKLIISDHNIIKIINSIKYPEMERNIVEDIKKAIDLFWVEKVQELIEQWHHIDQITIFCDTCKKNLTDNESYLETYNALVKLPNSSFIIKNLNQSIHSVPYKIFSARIHHYREKESVISRDPKEMLQNLSYIKTLYETEKTEISTVIDLIWKSKNEIYVPILLWQNHATLNQITSENLQLLHEKISKTYPNIEIAIIEKMYNFYKPKILFIRGEVHITPPRDGTTLDKIMKVIDSLDAIYKKTNNDNLIDAIMLVMQKMRDYNKVNEIGSYLKNVKNNKNIWTMSNYLDDIYGRQVLLWKNIPYNTLKKIFINETTNTELKEITTKYNSALEISNLTWIAQDYLWYTHPIPDDIISKIKNKSLDVEHINKILESINFSNTKKDNDENPAILSYIINCYRSNKDNIVESFEKEINKNNIAENLVRVARWESEKYTTTELMKLYWTLKEQKILRHTITIQHITYLKDILQKKGISLPLSQFFSILEKHKETHKGKEKPQENEKKHISQLLKKNISFWAYEIINSNTHVYIWVDRHGESIPWYQWDLEDSFDPTWYVYLTHKTWATLKWFSRWDQKNQLENIKWDMSNKLTYFVWGHWSWFDIQFGEEKITPQDIFISFKQRALHILPREDTIVFRSCYSQEFTEWLYTLRYNDTELRNKKALPPNIITSSWRYKPSLKIEQHAWNTYAINNHPNEESFTWNNYLQNIEAEVFSIGSSDYNNNSWIFIPDATFWENSNWFDNTKIGLLEQENAPSAREESTEQLW